ncbi:putative regulatory protein [Mycobacteroides abscessus subsp. abscessus]|nr:putative regulatory protein [Mycobacteroides abscessus subsp. abscessus]
MRDVRTELSPAEARFLVHAAFALVVDLGRAFGSDPVAGQQRVRTAMEIVLFGRPVTAR